MCAFYQLIDLLSLATLSLSPNQWLGVRYVKENTQGSFRNVILRDLKIRHFLTRIKRKKEEEEVYLDPSAPLTLRNIYIMWKISVVFANDTEQACSRELHSTVV